MFYQPQYIRQVSELDNRCLQIVHDILPPPAPCARGQRVRLGTVGCCTVRGQRVRLRTAGCVRDDPAVRPGERPSVDRVRVADRVAVDRRHHVGVLVVVDVGDGDALSVDDRDGGAVIVHLGHRHVGLGRPADRGRKRRLRTRMSLEIVVLKKIPLLDDPSNTQSLQIPKFKKNLKKSRILEDFSFSFFHGCGYLCCVCLCSCCLCFCHCHSSSSSSSSHPQRKIRCLRPSRDVQ